MYPWDSWGVSEHVQVLRRGLSLRVPLGKQLVKINLKAKKGRTPEGVLFTYSSS